MTVTCREKKEKHKIIKKIDTITNLVLGMDV